MRVLVKAISVKVGLAALAPDDFRQELALALRRDALAAGRDLEEIGGGGNGTGRRRLEFDTEAE